MAAVLETITVPRASALPSSSLAQVAGYSFSGPRFSVSFSQFSGLKIQPIRSSVSTSSCSKIIPRGGRVVCEAQDTAVEVATVSDKTWKTLVVESTVPVLVEFWAPWCGPCRMIHPVIDELAKEYVGKLTCLKLNTDESPSIATEFGIRSIPTVMIFKNGEKKDAIIGAVPKSTLTTSIEKFLYSLLEFSGLFNTLPTADSKFVFDRAAIHGSKSGHSCNVLVDRVIVGGGGSYFVESINQGV